MAESAHAVAANTRPGAAQPLAAGELRALRARAHALKPVVRIGASGATQAVLRELDRALAAHELVKIHAAVDDRAERARLLDVLCAALGAQPVQMIGKMLIAYRPRPPENAQAANAAGQRKSAATRRPGEVKRKRPQGSSGKQARAGSRPRGKPQRAASRPATARAPRARRR